MNGTTALILIGAVVVIVFVLGVNMIRRGRLRSLSPELKSRHAQSWTMIGAYLVNSDKLEDMFR